MLSDLHSVPSDTLQHIRFLLLFYLIPLQSILSVQTRTRTNTPISRAELLFGADMIADFPMLLSAFRRFVAEHRDALPNMR